MKNISFKKKYLFFLIIFSLAGCSGGDSESSSPVVTEPIVTEPVVNEGNEIAPTPTPTEVFPEGVAYPPRYFTQRFQQEDPANLPTVAELEALRENSGLLTERSSLVPWTESGDIRVGGTEANPRIIEGFEFTGRVRIFADWVTVRNCYSEFPIDSLQLYPYDVNQGAVGVLIEHVEIKGAKSSSIYGSGTFRNNRLWFSAGDAIKATHDSVVEGNYIFQLGTAADAHADGVQMTSGSNVRISKNFFDMPPGVVIDGQTYKNSQNIIISTNNAPIDNILIQGNLHRGSGQGSTIPIQVLDKGNGFGIPSNVVVVDGWWYEADIGFQNDGVTPNQAFRVNGIEEPETGNSLYNNRSVETGLLLLNQQDVVTEPVVTEPVETVEVLPTTGNFIDNDDSLYIINDDVRFSKSTVSVVGTQLSCDCDSTDPSMPCVGSSLTDQFTGTPSNGTTFRDPIFSYEFNSNGGQAYCGRFASGDYWVAPKEGETLQLTKISGNSQVSAELDLASSTSTGILGSLFDYGNYDETKNAVLNLPISLDSSNNQLLLTAMHKEVGSCGTKAILDGCVDAYNFVTFLTDVPENLGRNMMRPNVGANPNNLYTFDDFNLERLIASSEFDKAAADDLKSINEKWRGFTEIFTNFSEGGRAFRSHTLVDDYSSGTYNGWYNSFVMISSSANTFEEKKAALASMLTFGADMYQVFEGNNTIGTRWSSGAGQFTGMIAPLLFFSSTIERPDIAYQVSQISKRADVGEAGSIGEEGYKALQDAALPQEFKQILPGKNGPIWGDITTINRYWSAIHAGGCYAGSLKECDAAQGKKTSWDPYGYIDGPSIKPGSSYLSVTRGMFGNYGTMMWMNDAMCDIANHDLPIQFVDRIKSDGLLTSNDECAPPDTREPVTCDPWRNGKGCTYYGVTWGPTNENPYQCVKNNSGGKTGQNGRFPTYDGTVVEANGYVNFALEKSYETFKNGRNNCRSAIFNTTPAVSNFENDDGVLKWAASTHLNNGAPLDYDKYFGWYKISYISPDSTERAVLATTDTSFDTALLDDGANDFIVEACLYNGSCVELTEQ